MEPYVGYVHELLANSKHSLWLFFRLIACYGSVVRSIIDRYRTCTLCMVNLPPRYDSRPLFVIIVHGNDTLYINNARSSVGFALFVLRKTRTTTEI